MSDLSAKHTKKRVSGDAGGHGAPIQKAIHKNKHQVRRESKKRRTQLKKQKAAQKALKKKQKASDRGSQQTKGKASLSSLGLIDEVGNGSDTSQNEEKGAEKWMRIRSSGKNKVKDYVAKLGQILDLGDTARIKACNNAVGKLVSVVEVLKREYSSKFENSILESKIELESLSLDKFELRAIITTTKAV